MLLKLQIWKGQDGKQVLEKNCTKMQVIQFCKKIVLVKTFSETISE